MDPNRDGKIGKPTIGQDWIETKIACSAVEGGELTIYISPHPNGWIHMHFSGLGSKVIKTVQTTDNGIDIYVKA